MPWARYQASPIGISPGSERRPRVYTGGCSSSSRTPGSSPACTRARTRSCSATPSRYSTSPRWQTCSSSIPISLRPERELPGRVGEAAVLDLRELRELVLGGAAGAGDVADRGAADEQRVGEQPPVAAPPRRLRAHHGDALLSGPGLQPLEPARELLARHVVGVALERRVLPAGVGRARHARA